MQAPAPPAFLAGEARREWDRQVAELLELQLLAKLDRAALALWCQAWGEYCDVMRLLREKAGDKKTIAKVASEKGMSRLIWIRKDARDTLLKIAVQFGFTPAARARLDTAENPSTPADPVEAFFQRSAN